MCNEEVDEGRRRHSTLSGHHPASGLAAAVELPEALERQGEALKRAPGEGVITPKYHFARELRAHFQRHGSLTDTFSVGEETPYDQCDRRSD